MVPAVQNKIDVCIISARDRRGYVLERRWLRLGPRL